MNKHIIKYAFLLIVTALAACNITKDIAKPQPELPTNFRNATTIDTNSIAAIPWKDFIKDASLQSLIDTAIVKNYDMQIAVKNIEAAQLVFKQIKFNYLPTAVFNLAASTTRYSDNSLTGLQANQYLSSPHIEDYSANVALGWEADIWGKIKNRQSAALAAYLQTTEARKAIQTNIVASISEGYYNLLMLDEQLKIAQQNVALNDSTLRIIKLQFDAGQVTSLAIEQATAQRLAAAQLIPQFEQDITLQENAISILTGELPDAVKRNATLQSMRLEDTYSAGVPAEMVSLRPDVRSYELALNIANANVGIAKANMYPSLRITANFGVNSFKASNWFSIPSSLFGAVAGGIAQPLFQQKQLKTQYEIAQVQRDKTVIQFRQSVLNAVGEVSDALVKIDKLKGQQAIAASRVITLQEATSNANMLFKNGMANYLEVITAQGNVLQSELTLASLKRSQLNAVVELYRALGGGWK